MKYMFRIYFSNIERWEVTRLTESYVWIGRTRHKLRSKYDSWHHTWEEARDELLARLQSQRDDSLREFNLAFEKIKEVESMQKPEGW